MCSATAAAWAFCDEDSSSSSDSTCFVCAPHHMQIDVNVGAPNREFKIDDSLTSEATSLRSSETVDCACLSSCIDTAMRRNPGSAQVELASDASRFHLLGGAKLGVLLIELLLQILHSSTQAPFSISNRTHDPRQTWQGRGHKVGMVSYHEGRSDVVEAAGDRLLALL